MSGDLTDGNGNRSSIEIVHQLPDLLHVRGIRSDNAPLQFDGGRIVLPLARPEEAFLQSFAEDTAEALLDAERSGAAIRLLGFNFISDSETPERPEVRFDIYQMTSATKTHPGGIKRTKLYWFEAKTNLLLRTT